MFGANREPRAIRAKFEFGLGAPDKRPDSVESQRFAKSVFQEILSQPEYGQFLDYAKGIRMRHKRLPGKRLPPLDYLDE